jgi:hypothetical protein
MRAANNVIFSIYSICVLTICSCGETKKELNTKTAINKTIDNWHAAASKTDYEQYFSLMTADAVFIGTDPTENWSCDSFKTFCKPYFDKGKAWNFTSVSRNIYWSEDNKLAWFDELLNTPMKICRGSGVVVLQNNTWRIKHYVLSMTIPNANTNNVVKLKTVFEDSLLKTFIK